MPSKKKKYNARFPPARIKKIMQMDEEVGKVAATVPVIISRALELFIESLIQQATQMTLAKNAKTLSASHLKYIIESQERYRFLKELVASVSDHQMEEDPTPIVNHHNDEEKSPSSSVPGKRPRGRPRKSQDVGQVTQKKERRKRKKESSSSESENSEDTDDADEGTDEDPVPAASSVVSAVSSSSSSTETSGPSSSSSADLPTPTKATTTLSHPLPISELLAQSQEKRSVPEHQGESASVESDPTVPQPQQQEVASAVVGPAPAASTFQGTPAMMPAAVPMYQSVAGVAAPNLFAWPNPAAMLGGGFPSLPAQGSAFAGLQPQGPGFPGMMLPGLGFPAVSPSLMTFQGLPGMGFAGVSPLTPGFSGVSVAGTGLAGVTSKAPATAGTPNGAQGDDDYDT